MHIGPRNGIGRDETATLRSIIDNWNGGRVNPSHEQIKLRAYQLWEERGRPCGTSEEDWLKAERELMEQPQRILTKLAREVGSVVGSAVASLNVTRRLIHKHHGHRKS